MDLIGLYKRLILNTMIFSSVLRFRTQFFQIESQIKSLKILVLQLLIENKNILFTCFRYTYINTIHFFQEQKIYIYINTIHTNGKKKYIYTWSYIRRIVINCMRSTFKFGTVKLIDYREDDAWNWATSVWHASVCLTCKSHLL